MKPSSSRNRINRLTTVTIDAFCGRAGAVRMVLAYSVLTVVLLSYVSLQVYTHSLMEDIATRQRQVDDAHDRLCRVAGEYAQLSTRTRVGNICESQLGLREAGLEQVKRVAVSAPTRKPLSSLYFTENRTESTSLFGANTKLLSEVRRR